MSAPRLERELGIETYASHSSGVGGRIRQFPEDFIVEEVLIDGSKARISTVEAELPEGDGKHLICVLVKRDWDTFLAVRKIARQLHISHRRIQIAGIKDAKALTAQHISILGVMPEQVSKVKSKDIVLHPLRFSNETVFPHLLLGNQFHTTVRAISYASYIIEQRVKSVQEELSGLGGFPNFFGHQRFGTVRPVTHFVGKHLAQGDLEEAVLTFLARPGNYEHPESKRARKQLGETLDFEEALRHFPATLKFERLMLTHLTRQPKDYVGAFRRLPQKLRRLLVQAYQSYLFNRSLSQRIKQGIPLNEVQVGDYALTLDERGLPTGNVAQVTGQSLTDINDALRKKKMRLAIPLIGYKQSPSQGVQGEIEREILESEGVTPKNFHILSMPEISAPGGLRAISAPVLDFSIREIDKDAANPSRRRVTLGFMLHRGSYATALLREFMKPRDLIKAGF